LKLAWDELQKATDPELVAQLRSGNDDAFAMIVDRYRRLVFSVALRIVKHESEAEDVLQNVFVEIYKRCGNGAARSGHWAPANLLAALLRDVRDPAVPN
jgi:RNA polymerase sigma-70 factor (ECF subfamily)